MTQSTSHPVWDLYDEIRTARLNCKYYTHRLCALERLATVFDVTLAAVAPGSALAGWAYLQSEIGKTTWAVASAVAAIVAFVKPFLKLPDKIKQLEAVVSGYRMLESELAEIRVDVSQQRAYTAAHSALLQRALRRKQALVDKTPVDRDDDELKKKCEQEVRSELPVSSFFVPT